MVYYWQNCDQIKGLKVKVLISEYPSVVAVVVCLVGFFLLLYVLVYKDLNCGLVILTHGFFFKITGAWFSSA